MSTTFLRGLCHSFGPASVCRRTADCLRQRRDVSLSSAHHSPAPASVQPPAPAPGSAPALAAAPCTTPSLSEQLPDRTAFCVRDVVVVDGAHFQGVSRRIWEAIPNTLTPPLTDRRCRGQTRYTLELKKLPCKKLCRRLYSGSSSAGVDIWASNMNGSSIDEPRVNTHA